MKKYFALGFVVLAALLSSCQRGEAAPAAAPTTIETTTGAVTQAAPEYLALPELLSLPAGTSADANSQLAIGISQLETTAQASTAPSSKAATQTAALTAKPATTKAAATSRYVYTNNHTTVKATTKATASTTTAATSTATISVRQIANATTTTQQTRAAVSFAIDGSAAVPYGYDIFMPARAMTLNSGDTVFDLLGRSGVPVQSRGGGMTAYVVAIGGLAEKDCGGTSGWVYEVNGTRPNMSCGRYQPQNGDAIVWRYSLTQ